MECGPVVRGVSHDSAGRTVGSQSCEENRQKGDGGALVHWWIGVVMQGHGGKRARKQRKRLRIAPAKSGQATRLAIIKLKQKCPERALEPPQIILAIRSQ